MNSEEAKHFPTTIHYSHYLRAREQRDEARRWARRMMAERNNLEHIMGLQVKEIGRLSAENAALRRELEDAARDALDARKAWGVAEAECLRLRAELEALRKSTVYTITGKWPQDTDDLPPHNAAIVIDNAAKFLVGEAKRMRKMYRPQDDIDDQ